MISIPQLGIILIIVIVVLYLIIIRNKKVELDEEPEIFVLFNKPFFIKPHELVDLILMLSTSDDAEIKRVLYLRCEKNVEPDVDLNKYFSMYEYVCEVTKLEHINKDTVKVELTFRKISK